METPVQSEEVPQNIIDKVAKLLKLSSNNPSFAEAQSAATAAAKLIDKYRIDQAIIDAASGEADQINVEKEPVIAGGRISEWKKQLVDSLASHYGCACYSSGRDGNRKMFLTGRKNDITLLKYMLNWIVSTIEVYSVIECHGKGGKSYSNSWKLGAVAGIDSQFKKMREELKREIQNNQAMSTALVCLNNRVRESEMVMYQTVPNLRTIYSPGATNGAAFGKGKVFGSNLNLSNKKALT